LGSSEICIIYRFSLVYKHYYAYFFSNLSFQLICGNDITSFGSKRLTSIRNIKPNIAEGSIEFDVTQTPLVSSCRLVVYYVRQDGDVVADSSPLEVQHSQRNKVICIKMIILLCLIINVLNCNEISTIICLCF